MRIFISYGYTGYTIETLNNTVGKLIQTLRNLGYNVFCNLENDSKYLEEKWPIKQIMTECFTELDTCDYHITFVAPTANYLGEGTLIEFGYAKKLKLPTLLLLPKTFHSVTTKAIADKLIYYDNMDQLLNELLPNSLKMNK